MNFVTYKTKYADPMFIIKAGEEVMIGNIVEGEPLLHISASHHIERMELLNSGKAVLAESELGDSFRASFARCGDEMTKKGVRLVNLSGTWFILTGAVGFFFPPAWVATGFAAQGMVVGTGTAITGKLLENLSRKARYVKFHCTVKSNLPPRLMEVAGFEFTGRMTEKAYDTFIKAIQTTETEDGEVDKAEVLRLASEMAAEMAAQQQR